MLILHTHDDGTVTVEHVADPDPNSEFAQGYRQGYPLVGEQLPPMPDNPSAEFSRGYEAGKQDYIPGIPYEDDSVYEEPEQPRGWFKRLFG